MLSEQQQTIKTTTSVDGRGLFLGQPAKVRFRPAPANHGVVFLRTDLAEENQSPRIPALIDHVTKRARRTTLRQGEATVETCEHVLSALSGLGLDNMVVEVDGPEIPAGDGSAMPFVDALINAGIEQLDQPRRVLKITEPVTVEEGEAMIAALPAEQDGMQIIYDLDYGKAGPVAPQLHAFNLTNGNYTDQIAPARTYVMEAEARALQSRGLGQHLTARDLLVIGEKGPIGGNKLRFDDELVRHKVLDLIGDLSLLGWAINGRIVAYRSGHSLNHRLARQLAKLRRAQSHSQLLGSDGVIDINRIQRVLPHRYPMLLIDRVLEVEADRRAVGVKNVTMNEPFFQGHYPGTPIMPGVLIVEAMAQLSGVLLSRKLEHTGKLAVLLSMDKVKLRRPALPGDQLVIEAHAVRVRSRTGHTACRAYIGPHLAAEAEIKFMLVDAEQE